MTGDSEPHGPAGRPGSPGSPTNPAGFPVQRPAWLDRLDVVVGQWEMEASFGPGYSGPGAPAITSRGGLTTFEWLPGGSSSPSGSSWTTPPPRAASRSSALVRSQRPGHSSRSSALRD